MADKPILFSAPMVRAILDGRKSQTRRVLKPQPLDDLGDIRGGPLHGPEWYEPATYNRDGEMVPGKPIWGVYDETGDFGCKVPYTPGDRLWVRETWQAFDGGSFQTRLGSARTYSKKPRSGDEIKYRADTDPTKDFGRYRSPIHMPRWASRLTLIVTDVRVQRVQEINEADAWCEGIDQRVDALCRDDFQRLWDSLNAKRGHGWVANPWVVAITFETHRCNIDAMETP